MIKQQVKQLGFTLMELLIAIAIVAILAAIAVPTYLSYTKKAYYSEVVQAGDQYKTAVSACLDQEGGILDRCNGGSNGIPADFSGASTGQVAGVEVANSVITVTPTNNNGFEGDETYILTPVYTPGQGISWTASGIGCTEALASC